MHEIIKEVSRTSIYMGQVEEEVPKGKLRSSGQR